MLGLVYWGWNWCVVLVDCNSYCLCGVGWCVCGVGCLGFLEIFGCCVLLGLFFLLVGSLVCVLGRYVWNRFCCRGWVWVVWLVVFYFGLGLGVLILCVRCGSSGVVILCVCCVVFLVWCVIWFGGFVGYSWCWMDFVCGLILFIRCCWLSVLGWWYMYVDVCYWVVVSCGRVLGSCVGWILVWVVVGFWWLGVGGCRCWWVSCLLVVCVGLWYVLGNFIFWRILGVVVGLVFRVGWYFWGWYRCCRLYYWRWWCYVFCWCVGVVFLVRGF